MTPPDRPITVLLVDDHPVVRGGLRALIESFDGFAVVGEAADGEQAVREVQLHRPDVVVMDVMMPHVDGIEATRRIVRACPGTAVLVLSMAEEDDVVFGAMQAGARGYLLKGAAQEEIDRALRAVVAGECRCPGAGCLRAGDDRPCGPVPGPDSSRAGRARTRGAGPA
jgi:DNA-binding NarL/FixJ family response regulator